MPPKRKLPMTQQRLTNKNGGSGRGQGRKPSKVNRAGIDHPDAPKRKQQGLGDLLGERVIKKARVITIDTTGGDNTEPWLKWSYIRHDGGKDDTAVPQQQRRYGSVQYDHFEHRGQKAKIVAVGPETYYVNKNDQLSEVESEHADAEPAQRHGGMVSIQFDGHEPQWVTCGHVWAVDGAPMVGGANATAGDTTALASPAAMTTATAPVATAKPVAAATTLATTSPVTHAQRTVARQTPDKQQEETRGGTAATGVDGSGDERLGGGVKATPVPCS